jgi:L-rhamnose isomerase/sugar isomerase
MIGADRIATDNERCKQRHDAAFDALATCMASDGVDVEALIAKATGLAVAVPSWGVGTGGTRFARFPGPGEPRGIEDKIDDCGVIHELCRVTPMVSLHIPWDLTDDPAALVERAAAVGLGFDAVNSNTFMDHAGLPQSYKFGSLSHTDAGVRAQAIAHNIDCIRFGQKIGSKALTVWIGDGSNFPGQAHLGRAFDRYLGAMKEVYAALPDDWRIFVEHKIYEPAFYSTVIQDWGSSYLAATELGPKAMCLVDLGHHAPNTNVEQIVARLVRFGRLGGFHFNDSKYGDDDLDSGSINPFGLFLVFNELIEAELSGYPDFAPAYMLDQSHNVTDPIESILLSAMEVQRAFVQGWLVDRGALHEAQERNDAIIARETLKNAFRTDVGPILAEARRRAGGALDPIATYRASRYRHSVARTRPASRGGGGGIV